MMESKLFSITKRDGQKVRFSLDKIMNAIIKAFESVGEPVDLTVLSKVLAHLDIHEDIKVEEIQNQVEESLMKEGFYQVAKSFMLYRQRHTEDRETMEKLNFLVDYCQAENAATGSKYDANANVEHKNIATLIGELPKASFIMARNCQTSTSTCLHTTLYIRTTRQVWQTIVPLSRCTPGSSAERHLSAATLRHQLT